MRKKVKDVVVGPNMTTGQLIDQMGSSGVFGAGRVSKAVDILEQMVRSNSTVYLGLAGAMVPGGMRKVIADMIRDGFVNVVVSTGANVTHDLMCSFGCPQWRQVSYSTDAELRSKGVSRIYDSFIDQDAFETFEREISSLLEKIVDAGAVISPSELVRRIGKAISDDSSFVRAAAECDVPIFVPAFTDSILGIQSYIFSQTHPFTLDVLADLGRMIDISFQSKRSGALLIGGGVPKNFILQSKLIAPNGFNFAIQITTDRPEPGGLSGATLDEAVSWGKLEGSARMVTVYGDATILLPLIVAAVRERLAGPKS